MAVLAHLHAPQRSTDRRVSNRRQLTLHANGIFDSESTTVLIHDISETGMLLQSTGGVPVGEKIAVSLPEAGEVTASVVWCSGAFTGCEFESRLPKAVVSAALLRSAAPSPPGSRSAGTPEDANEAARGRKLWTIVALALLAWAAVVAVIAAIL